MKYFIPWHLFADITNPVLPESSTILPAITIIAGIIIAAIIAIIIVVNIPSPSKDNARKKNIQLTCEICNSHKFTKTSTSFICDQCGCKYSMDDARALLSDTISQNDQQPKQKKKKHGLAIFILIAFVSVAIGCFCFIAPLPVVISQGITYRKTENGTYKAISYTKNEEKLEIPEKVRNVSVTEIEEKAFQDNNNLKTVIVPKTVEKIGKGAFDGCNSIKTIVLPFIGGTHHSNRRLDYIFNTSVPHSLKNVYLLDSCNSIGAQAFYLCENIENIYIPSTVTTIYDITQISIVGVNGHAPENKMEQSPFYGCSPNLKIHCESNNKSSGWGPYWNYIDENYSVAVRWFVQLKNDYTLTSGTHSTDAIDHSKPKTITLTINNFHQYFTVEKTLTVDEYSYNIINPGYQNALFYVSIKPKDKNYIFNNIQVKIEVTLDFQVKEVGLFSSDINEINASRTQILELKADGTLSTEFKFSSPNSIIYQPENMRGTCSITQVYGELIPIQ